MADLLNSQFQSVFTIEYQKNCTYIKPSSPIIFDIIVTEPGVNKLLKALKIGKASGVDNLPTRPLKECADNISQIVTFIFNQTLNTCMLPNDWKSANITPIKKKDHMIWLRIIVLCL